MASYDPRGTAARHLEAYLNAQLALASRPVLCSSSPPAAKPALRVEPIVEAPILVATKVPLSNAEIVALGIQALMLRKHPIAFVAKVSILLVDNPPAEQLKLANQIVKFGSQIDLIEVIRSGRLVSEEAEFIIIASIAQSCYTTLSGCIKFSKARDHIGGAYR